MNLLWGWLAGLAWRLLLRVAEEDRALQQFREERERQRREYERVVRKATQALESSAAPEPTPPDELRRLLGSPGDGAQQVSFTSEGGWRESLP